MNLIKTILPRILAIWAMVIFTITMLPVVLIMWLIGLLREPDRTAAFRNVSKAWMSIFFVCTGIRLKIKGKEHFRKGENYIVICNHNSFMDVPVATPFIPDANKTIAKIEMSRIPLFGLIYKRGSVLVDRKDKNSRRDSFRKMREVLEMGMHMCIYPEGTRNKTNLPMKEFHDGAFRLAVDTGKSLLPAIIFNTKKVLPPGKALYFWPAQLEMHFLPPVPVSSTDNYEMVKKKMYELMSSYYAMHQKPV